LLILKILYIYEISHAIIKNVFISVIYKLKIILNLNRLKKEKDRNRNYRNLLWNFKEKLHYQIYSIIINKQLIGIYTAISNFMYN